MNVSIIYNLIPKKERKSIENELGETFHEIPPLIPERNTLAMQWYKIAVIATYLNRKMQEEGREQ